MSTWRKASYSSQSGGSCVEVAMANVVMIRDTTDREGFTLSVSGAAWTKLLTTLK